ncbi:CARDB domain-containing protein [Planctomicrobium sp. SH527]|uniref:CARDB domain-containing protein n=1 Tax=Planctomicrobium sp. SH527 TaxID=3448123 RepID=UPI003F5CB218
MRRGAYILALLGLSVQSAVGNDINSVGTARTTPSARPESLGASATNPPQRFSRKASGAEDSNTELKNYYQELFGDTPPTGHTRSTLSGTRPATSGIAAEATVGTSAPGTAAIKTGAAGSAASAFATPGAAKAGSATPGSTTLGSATPAQAETITRVSAIKPAQPATVAAPSVISPAGAPAKATVSSEGEIIHADYKAKPNGESTIQQVRGDAGNARPFPGSEFAAGSPVKMDPTPFGASTTPATKPAATQTAVSPTQEIPSTGRGSVTFSKTGVVSSAPATASATNPTAPESAVMPSAKRTSSFAAASPAATRPGPQTTSVTSATVTTVATAPTVLVEWQKQSEINVGQECSCILLVKNVGQSAAHDVEVRAVFPKNVRLSGAVPAPATSESFLGWQFPELAAGEVRKIEISMVPMERGDIQARADVRFTGTAKGTFAVAEPMLNIQVEGPRQVMVGEAASHVVTISNPGTGIASNVQIEAIIPEGLEHARGRRLLMELGNLTPGESRSVRLALTAMKGGEHQLAVQAKSEAGLARSAESNVTVIAPMLATSIQGPGLRYLGRQGVYTITVQNDGAAATDNVQVRYKVPAGFEFVSADRGAQFDPATGLVSWFVGRVEKGQATEIRATLVARQAGEFKHQIRATSEHGVIADAECLTAVEGTSSLSIAVKDTEDPVEVTSKTCYEIRVRNEGSAAARNVGLVCELPSGMEYISAEGPVECLNEGGKLLFRNIPEVAAGQTITLKVHVACAVPGSMRFRAHLSSESVADPLTAEELTKFYGEQ